MCIHGLVSITLFFLLSEEFFQSKWTDKTNIHTHKDKRKGRTVDSDIVEDGRMSVCGSEDDERWYYGGKIERERERIKWNEMKNRTKFKTWLSFYDLWCEIVSITNNTQLMEPWEKERESNESILLLVRLQAEWTQANR